LGSSTPTSIRRWPWLLLFASAVGAALAHLGAVAMPFQIGAVIDSLHVSSSRAGAFGFLELGALALAMILSPRWIGQIHAAALAIGGAALAALANLGMFLFTPGFAELAALAVVVGTGYGIVFSATIAGVSSAADADRVFALSSGGSVCVVVALMTALPRVSTYFGALGPFLAMGVFVLAACPFLLGLGAGAHRGDDAPTPRIGSPGAVAIYIMWGCFSLGSGVAWSFAERTGRAMALSPQTIGAVLSASTFVGVGGTLLAAATAGRWPRLQSAALGLIGTGAGCLLFSTAGNTLTFALGALCFWVSSMFFYCVILGTAAALDPSGRVGVSGGGCDRLGFACGAPLGGVIVDHSSFAVLGWASALICILPAFYCLPVLKRALDAKAGQSALAPVV
jgi:predicted MFS family arabinose efflux permease